MNESAEKYPLALDIQSTGASPKHGSILEIGWAPLKTSDASPTSLDIESYIVEPASLPSTQIQDLTGITPDDLNQAYSAEYVRSELKKRLNKSKFVVIHYAKFEKRFLTDFFNCDDDQLPPIVCTHKLASQTNLELPSLGIRALSGFFGRTLPEQKRVVHHIRATALIWRELTSEIPTEICHNPSLLRKKFMTSNPLESSSSTTRMDRQKRLSLPKKPGIYFFKNPSGELLYIGKAKNLKNRVNSYFQGMDSLSRVKKEMVTQIDSVDTQIFETPLEAAVAEPDRIKEFEPPYNQAFKHGDRKIHWVESKNDSNVKCLGPFLRRQNLQWFQNMMDIDPFKPDSWSLNRQFEANFNDLGRRTFRSAIQDWLRLHGLVVAPRSPNTIERVGQKLWIRRYLKKQIEDDKTENAEIAPYIEILSYLNAKLRSLARRLRLGRWFYLLQNATVTWETPEGALRTIMLKDSEISFRGKRRHPPNKDQYREVYFDPIDSVGSYDRLIALNLELKRLLRESKNVEVKTPIETMADDTLEHLLFWV